MKKLSIAIALACLAVGAVAASASPPTVGSTVTINILRGPSDTFYGEVTSQKSACAKQRSIKVEKVRPGADQVIGTGITDANGQWHVVTAPAANGKYYAKATKKSTSKFICKPAKSDTITVS
jgi:hypothetical protein